MDKKTATLEGNGQKKPQHWRGMVPKHRNIGGEWSQNTATFEGNGQNTATLDGEWNKNRNIGGEWIKKLQHWRGMDKQHRNIGEGWVKHSTTKEGKRRGMEQRHHWSTLGNTTK